ncbi:MAG TPA: hypothetical protein VEO91_07785 [Candidatus Limnocylindria bacterium]|nr:hypothetical protein [Candidatus Limnocylindria bacterium]
MASQLTFPYAPADDPIRPAIFEPRVGVGVYDAREPERDMEIVDEIGTFAEPIPAAGATESDSFPVDLPVGSWFG